MQEEYVKLLNSMGNDLTVVQAARVSMGVEAKEFTPKDARLIDYLARNKHWTPFSHVQLQFYFKMPVFVARQWYRHTVGLTVNEISRRYVDKQPEFYLPEHFRERAENVKQGSGDEVAEPINEALRGIAESCYQNAYSGYQTLLNNNVCPEQARMVLPQAMFTEFYQTGSLYAYARICKQRLDPHAQKEIRDYAQEISNLIEGIAAVSWAALMKY